MLSQDRIHMDTKCLFSITLCHDCNEIRALLAVCPRCSGLVGLHCRRSSSFRIVEQYLLMQNQGCLAKQVCIARELSRAVSMGNANCITTNAMLICCNCKGLAKPCQVLKVVFKCGCKFTLSLDRKFPDVGLSLGVSSLAMSSRQVECRHCTALLIGLPVFSSTVSRSQCHEAAQDDGPAGGRRLRVDFGKAP